MSWIQENKFAAGLAAVTMVGVGGLWYWGNGNKEKTADAHDQFQDAANQIVRFEAGRLYPSEQNRDMKNKAVSDYVEQAGRLRERMTEFRPKTLEPVAPNVFSEQLQAASGRARSAFETSQTTLPPSFMLGFEPYSNSVAQGEATPLLTYPVGALEWLFTTLAEARPVSLINVYRKPLPEEKGREFSYAKGQVARDLPVEVTFSGTSKSLREFMSALVDSKDYYFIPRVVRIENEKQLGPTRSDAQFKTASTAPAEGGFDIANFTAGADVVPPADGAAAPVLPSAPASEEILKQVLGNEKITVFLRLDLRLFREASSVPLPELPKRP